MTRLKSIRVRLTLWYAMALLLLLGLFSGLLWLAMRHRLLSELDQDLAARAGRFEQYFRGESAEVANDAQLRDELDEFCQGLPEWSYVNLRGSNGFEFHYPEAGAAANSSRIRTAQRYFTSAGQNFDLDVGAPTANLGHTLDLLRLLLLSLLPLVILIACVGGAWLAARALRPIQDITAAAGAISIENLSARLPELRSGDELARLTEVLNRMLERMEAAVKRLSQFAADASHELRTPLAVIRTTAELALRRTRPVESYRESLAEVVAETERMTQLVEDLLTLARTGTEASQMPRSPLELSALLGEVCAELRNLAASRQIHLDSDWKDDGVVVSGNRAALRRLFVILLDNAIKFSRAGSTVRVGLTHSGNAAHVTVQDSGEGVPQADLPRIFERHFRGGDGHGYGIGLALADYIARAHAASVEVSSSEAGSVFRVSFATVAAAQGASANPQIAALS